MIVGLRRLDKQSLPVSPFLVRATQIQSLGTALLSGFGMLGKPAPPPPCAEGGFPFLFQTSPRDASHLNL